MWSQRGPVAAARSFFRSFFEVEIDQRAAFLDVVELGLVDAGMLLRRIDGLDPGHAHDDAEGAHHEEHIAPAIIVRDPAHQRREDHGREILPGIEEGGRSAALIAGKPGRHDTGIGGEGGRFGDAHQEAQPEQDGDRGPRAEEADPALKRREQRPDDDGEGIDEPRAVAIEQPAARHLRDHIGPAEGRKM